MDLVSFDTKGEFEMFAEIMKRGETISSVSFLNLSLQHQLQLLFFLVLPCFVHGPVLLRFLDL